jgi:ABC-type sulfate/molybdate transport systems ATPase subunit
VTKSEAARRSHPWLEAFGIETLAGRDVRTLSGGEAQRACIARALATDPRVLLLDEPFGGLDAPTRADLIADLRAALAGRSIAVVLVTHDVEEARALAGVTALLIQGERRLLGPTAEVLDSPVDLDTARLLGFVNALPPSLTGGDTIWVAKPEHCRAMPPATSPGSAVASVAGTVRRHIPLGAVTRIDVEVATGLLTCLHPIQENADVEIGQSVIVQVGASRRLPASACATGQN